MRNTEIHPNTTIVDAHCHVGAGRGYSLPADELLRRMDANGVTAAVVVPTDHCIAVHNRQGNEETLRAAKSSGGRLISFATVNPWYGDEAVRELRRAFDEGAAGLKLHPVLQGFSPIDEVVFPVVELAIRMERSIYFHTGTPVHSTPFQMLELALRYPEGCFVMGHAAYSDYWNDLAAAVKGAPNLYVETSLHLASFLRVLLEQLGADRLIYGSDAPRTSMDVEIEKITRYVRDDESRRLVFGANLARMLGDFASWQ